MINPQGRRLSLRRASLRTRHPTPWHSDQPSTRNPSNKTNPALACSSASWPQPRYRLVIAEDPAAVVTRARTGQRVEEAVQTRQQKGGPLCALSAKVDSASSRCHCRRPLEFANSCCFQTRRQRSIPASATAWPSRRLLATPRCFATASSLMPTVPSKQGSGLATSSREIRWKCSARSNALASSI